MKFDPNLNYYENLKARQNSDYRSHAPTDEYLKLNEEELAQLMALNLQLRSIEEKFLPIMNAKGGIVTGPRG